MCAFHLRLSAFDFKGLMLTSLKERLRRRKNQAAHRRVPPAGVSARPGTPDAAALFGPHLRRSQRVCGLIITLNIRLHPAGRSAAARSPREGSSLSQRADIRTTRRTMSLMCHTHGRWKPVTGEQKVPQRLHVLLLLTSCEGSAFRGNQKALQGNRHAEERRSLCESPDAA